LIYCIKRRICYEKTFIKLFITAFVFTSLAGCSKNKEVKVTDTSKKTVEKTVKVSNNNVEGKEENKTESVANNENDSKRKVKILIKHIVMWKLKDFSEGKNKLENAQIIKRDLEALKDKIRELKYIEVGININESEQAYDVVLYSEFNSIKDLNTYQNHEEHLKVAGFIRKVVDARIVTDYETNIK